MAITNCPNGHYYDDALFPECPYCKKMEQPSGGFGSTEFAGAMFGGGTSAAPSFEPEQRVRQERGTMIVTPGAPAAHSAGGSGPKTQMFYDTSKYSSDPAAGWLVCIGGPDKGKDFTLITEKTLIGRSGSGSYKVELSDQKISRNAPVAVIAYLADSRSFVISPVPGGNLTLTRNNAYLSGPETLNDNDVIRIGDTSLVFISFCGSNFDWDSYQVKFPPKTMS